MYILKTNTPMNASRPRNITAITYLETEILFCSLWGAASENIVCLYIDRQYFRMPRPLGAGQCLCFKISEPPVPIHFLTSLSGKFLWRRQLTICLHPAAVNRVSPKPVSLWANSQRSYDGEFAPTLGDLKFYLLSTLIRFKLLTQAFGPR